MPGDRPASSRYDALDRVQAGRLMQLVRGMRRGPGAMSPLEALEWFLFDHAERVGLEQLLAEGPLRELGPASRLVSGELGLEQLRRLKEESKRMMAEAADERSRVAGVAGYFLAVAAARRHHGETISSRDPDQVRRALRRLASIAPEPFAGLLAAGADAD